MVVAGVFLVARLFPLFEAVPNAQLLVASVGITTALLGASLALVMTDIKRVLAYSTISHLGLMMVALGAGGYTAALFHLLTHGVAKAMLFLTAGSVMHAMHDETDIRNMGGLRRRMPISAAAFTLGALALAGIPPLAGFWSKDEMLLAVQQGLSPVFLGLFLVAALLSALYMARVWRLVFFGAPKPEAEHAHESPLVMSGPLVVLGLCTMAVGFVTLPLAGEGSGLGGFLFFEHAHGFEFSALWGPIGIVVAVAGFALGAVLYAGPAQRVERLRQRFASVHRWLANKYYLDDAYQWLIDNVSLRAARFTAVFDRIAVNDGGVNGTGGTVLNAGRRARALTTGRLYNYGLAMGLGVLAVALLMWLWV